MLCLPTETVADMLNCTITPRTASLPSCNKLEHDLQTRLRNHKGRKCSMIDVTWRNCCNRTQLEGDQDEHESKQSENFMCTIHEVKVRRGWAEDK